MQLNKFKLTLFALALFNHVGELELVAEQPWRIVAYLQHDNSANLANSTERQKAEFHDGNTQQSTVCYISAASAAITAATPRLDAFTARYKYDSEFCAKRTIVSKD